MLSFRSAIRKVDMLISVIVPVYKVEKYIRRCIDSILNQTFSDFELIIVDDGSPDNCGKICDEYAKKDNRIYVIHKENGGLSDARNAGLDWAFAHSDSEWITFIDSDDWIPPKYLEALSNAVNETGCEISICAYDETEGELPAVDVNKLKTAVVNTESFFCDHNVNAVVAWGKLYKKEIFKDIRYPVGKLHEDEFTTYKLLFQNEHCVFVNQPLYFYFQNTDSITKSEWNPKRLDALEAISEQMSFFKVNEFNNAFLYLLRHINDCIINQMIAIEKSNNSENKNYYIILQKALRKNLNRCKKYYVVPFKEDRYKYYYEYAYPFTMKCYWYYRVIKQKVKKRK